ncbi:LysR family transcriptional regulator [Neobacillus cucumis]|uniref:LysR family transcriptional regulator n=1 Tax=Neobacillus cucumis TaxID=1740721 RepID=UPI0018E03534|nr:LysR family transcriptional regulator [Neobacillus cucumis]MBI0576771.1 LysR family transcriptional regulator [Neobacillus cucumis]
MNEKDWVILQTIFEERNISKAAEKLYISQPALTYRLQQLEREFDTMIVARGKRGVEFTPQGEYLAQYARNMILQYRNTKEYLQNLDKEIRGSLRIGVSGIFARYELPAILKEFIEQYPNVEVIVKTGWSVEINHMLHKEEVHLGIVRGNYFWQEEKYLFHEEPMIIVSKKPITDLKELPKIPRVNYETDQTQKTLIDNWWEETFDQPPTITMEVDRIDTCKEMVLMGLGYAILPSICLKEDEDVYKIKLTNKNNKLLTRSTWLLYRERSLSLSAVNAFVDFLKASQKERE